MTLTVEKIKPEKSTGKWRNSIGIPSGLYRDSMGILSGHIEVQTLKRCEALHLRMFSCPHKVKEPHGWFGRHVHLPCSMFIISDFTTMRQLSRLKLQVASQCTTRWDAAEIISSRCEGGASFHVSCLHYGRVVYRLVCIVDFVIDSLYIPQWPQIRTTGLAIRSYQVWMSMEKNHQFR